MCKKKTTQEKWEEFSKTVKNHKFRQLIFEFIDHWLNKAKKKSNNCCKNDVVGATYTNMVNSLTVNNPQFFEIINNFVNNIDEALYFNLKNEDKKKYLYELVEASDDYFETIIRHEMAEDLLRDTLRHLVERGELHKTLVNGKNIYSKTNTATNIYNPNSDGVPKIFAGDVYNSSIKSIVVMDIFNQLKNIKIYPNMIIKIIEQNNLIAIFQKVKSVEITDIPCPDTLSSCEYSNFENHSQLWIQFLKFLDQNKYDVKFNNKNYKSYFDILLILWLKDLPDYYDLPSVSIFENLKIFGTLFERIRLEKPLNKSGKGQVTIAEIINNSSVTQQMKDKIMKKDIPYFQNQNDLSDDDISEMFSILWKVPERYSSIVADAFFNYWLAFHKEKDKIAMLSYLKFNDISDLFDLRVIHGNMPSDVKIALKDIQKNIQNNVHGALLKMENHSNTQLFKSWANDSNNAEIYEQLLNSLELAVIQRDILYSWIQK